MPVKTRAPKNLRAVFNTEVLALFLRLERLSQR